MTDKIKDLALYIEKCYIEGKAAAENWRANLLLKEKAWYEIVHPDRKKNDH